MKADMKIEYDTGHDLLNIEFLANVPVDDSVEVDGVVIDYAKDKRIVAIEVLDASKRTTREPLDLINLPSSNLPNPMSFGEKGRRMAERAKIKDERRGPKILDRDLGCQNGKNEMT
jgi:uncharacterized protein YuzE